MTANIKNITTSYKLATLVSRFFSLKNKILWPIIFISLFVVFLTHLFLVEKHHNEEYLQLVQSYAVDLVSHVTRNINGDLHKAIKSPTQQNTPEYLQAIQPLLDFQKEHNDIIRIYTLIEKRGTVYFVLDTATQPDHVATSGVEASPVMTLFKQSSAADANWLAALRQGEITVAGDYQQDSVYNKFIPAYAPFYDSEMNYAGIVGVAVSVEYLKHLSLGPTSFFYIGLSIVLFMSIALSTLICWLNKLLTHEIEKNLLQAHLATAATLTAGILHELKNGVMGVESYSKLISMSSDQPEKVETYVHKLDIQTKKVANIVENFLNFCRLDNEQLRQVNLAEAVNRTLDLFSHQFKKMGVHVEFDCQRSDFSLLCNPQLIEQVFVNLIDNACHAISNKNYTDSEQGEIVISLTKVKKSDQDFYLLSIFDNGVGISKSDMNLIGSPFFSTRKKCGKGNGLGMSNSINIVSQYDGEIKIYSEAGKYARINVCLPIKDSIAVENNKDYEERLQYANGNY